MVDTHREPDSQPVQVTSGDFDHASVDWSQDGQNLVFVSARHDTRDTDLVTRKAGIGRLLATGYVTGAAVIVSLPFIGGTPVTRTAVLAALFLVSGAIVSANIAEMSIRQAATPNDLQGRVAAGFGFLITGLTPLAALVAGAAAARSARARR